MPGLWKALYMAEEMGARLGKRKVLLRPLPPHKTLILIVNGQLSIKCPFEDVEQFNWRTDH
jgi:hypothetical protein